VKAERVYEKLEFWGSRDGLDGIKRCHSRAISSELIIGGFWHFFTGREEEMEERSEKF
jgi:hypothetical protein